MQLHKQVALTVFLVALLGGASSFAQSGAASRPARIGGQPNINGIWQTFGSAHWNLEAHSAAALKEFWALGSLAAIPAGQSVIDGPFQIVQSGGNILFVYTYASANRLVNMGDPIVPPVDTRMGQSNGRCDGDALVVETTGFNGMTWLDRAGNHHTNALKVTERFTPISDNDVQYSATLEDASVYSRPWTISMPLYRHIDPGAQILEFKCVPFVEELLYKDLELSQQQ